MISDLDKILDPNKWLSTVNYNYGAEILADGVAHVTSSGVIDPSYIRADASRSTPKKTPLENIIAHFYSRRP